MSFFDGIQGRQKDVDFLGDPKHPERIGDNPSPQHHAAALTLASWLDDIGSSGDDLRHYIQWRSEASIASGRGHESALVQAIQAQRRHDEVMKRGVLSGGDG